MYVQADGKFIFRRGLKGVDKHDLKCYYMNIFTEGAFS